MIGHEEGFEPGQVDKVLEFITPGIGMVLNYRLLGMDGGTRLAIQLWLAGVAANGSGESREVNGWILIEVRLPE